MGARKSKLPGVEKIKGKRGSTNNKRRLDAFSAEKTGTGADWGTADGPKLVTVVALITALGGAVTFGMSRNNGAYSLTLMLDDHRETLWFNGDADLNEELDGVAMTLDTMA
ncbi:hypothetical protein LCGC14_2932450 [marine sediment metagenome]|uniref:Uncharacterized protein n=1 Tax=marine sediment metagenome TaxID=412755 RepID=A0A0F9ABI7_9ZZZZ